MSRLHVKPRGERGKVTSITPQSAGWKHVGFEVHRLADLGQVDERHAPVLELLRHGDHEADVVAGQLLLRRHASLERLAGQLHLLVTRQQGHPADLVEIQVETFAPFVDRLGDLGRAHRPGLLAGLAGHDSRSPREGRSHPTKLRLGWLPGSAAANVNS